MGMYEVLELIGSLRGEITSRRVCDLSGLCFTSSSRNLNRLVKVGVLFVVPRGVGRHHVSYVLSPVGRELYRKLYIEEQTNSSYEAEKSFQKGKPEHDGINEQVQVQEVQEEVRQEETIKDAHEKKTLMRGYKC